MITNGICEIFALDILQGVHRPEHVYKLALFRHNAGLNTASKGYSPSGEADGKGYTPGGLALKGPTYSLGGGQASMNFANPTWPNSTLNVRFALLYNDSLPGKNAICVFELPYNNDVANGETISRNGAFTFELPAGGVAIGFKR